MLSNVPCLWDNGAQRFHPHSSPDSPEVLKRLGVINMRSIRKVFRSFSLFLSHLFGALLKTVFTSIVVGMFVVSIMHYMGVPIPSAVELLRGVSRLADVLS